MNVADRTPTDSDLALRTFYSEEHPPTEVPLFATFGAPKHLSPPSIDPGFLGRITAEIVTPADFRHDPRYADVLGWAVSVDCMTIYSTWGIHLYEGTYSTMRYRLGFPTTVSLAPGKYAIRVTKRSGVQQTFEIFWHSAVGAPLMSVLMGWGSPEAFRWTHLRVGMPPSDILLADPGFEGPTFRAVEQMRVNSVTTEIAP